jgi:hypothetical protein
VILGEHEDLWGGWVRWKRPLTTGAGEARQHQRVGWAVDPEHPGNPVRLPVVLMVNTDMHLRPYVDQRAGQAAAAHP